MTAFLANTITADMGLIPGLAIISPLFGLPLSVMAAVIERPFLTAAGLKRHAVWHSIQANFVSLLVGYPLVFVAAAMATPGSPFFLAWPFLAVLFSTSIERTYLNRGPAATTVTLGFGWALAANTVSALACISLIFLLHALDRPDLKGALRPYQVPLSVVLGVFCAAAVVAAFIIPRQWRGPALPVAAAAGA